MSWKSSLHASISQIASGRCRRALRPGLKDWSACQSDSSFCHRQHTPPSRVTIASVHSLPRRRPRGARSRSQHPAGRRHPLCAGRAGSGSSCRGGGRGFSPPNGSTGAAAPLVAAPFPTPATSVSPSQVKGVLPTHKPIRGARARSLVSDKTRNRVTTRGYRLPLGNAPGYQHSRR